MSSVVEIVSFFSFSFRISVRSPNAITEINYRTFHPDVIVNQTGACFYLVNGFFLENRQDDTFVPGHTSIDGLPFRRDILQEMKEIIVQGCIICMHSVPFEHQVPMVGGSLILSKICSNLKFNSN